MKAEYRKRKVEIGGEKKATKITKDFMGLVTYLKDRKITIINSLMHRTIPSPQALKVPRRPKEFSNHKLKHPKLFYHQPNSIKDPEPSLLTP